MAPRFQESCNPSDPYIRGLEKMKIHPGNGGTSKWTLRQFLYKHVSPELIERVKAGFHMSIGQWLRGPGRSWAEDLLEPGLMQRQGYLRLDPIMNFWRQHLSGRFDLTARLWSVSIFKLWLQEWRQFHSSSIPYR